MYWSVTTLTTIGYGDITPGTNSERIFTMIWMLTGVVFYSFTIGSLTSTISNIDTKKRIMQTKLNAANEWFREASIDRALANQVCASIKYHSNKMLSCEDKNTIFSDVPK